MFFILRWNFRPVDRPRRPRRSSRSTPIIRAASSSAWWAPAAPDNASPDSTPDCSPAAPGASTTPCRRTARSGALWSRAWSTPRRTSGMSCRVWVPSPGRPRRRSASRRSSPPGPNERRRRRGSRRSGSRRRGPTVVEHLHRRWTSGSTSKKSIESPDFNLAAKIHQCICDRINVFANLDYCSDWNWMKNDSYTSYICEVHEEFGNSSNRENLTLYKCKTA